jgi:hypothetical protein
MTRSKTKANIERGIECIGFEGFDQVRNERSIGLLRLCFQLGSKACLDQVMDNPRYESFRKATSFAGCHASSYSVK